MTPHPLLAALLLILCLVVAVALAAAGRAVILAATRHGRHVREFDRDLNKACGYEAGDGSLAAELRALPAPGKTIYTDRNVRLPRTPPLTYPRFEQEAAASDLAARRGERHLPRRPVELGPMEPGDVVEPDDDAECDLNDFCEGCWDDSQHCDGAVETCCCPCTWGEDWDEEDEDEEPDPFHTPAPDLCDCGTGPRHFPAGHDMVTSILTAQPKEPAWDVARLHDASVDDIPAAFDTGQFPAVIA